MRMGLGLGLGDYRTAFNPLAPANTVAPVASGTTGLGDTLSVTNGTWTNSPLSYAYQWQSNGSNIGGATSSTFDITASEQGTDVRCRVTATNASGSGVAYSNALTIPAAAGGEGQLDGTDADQSAWTVWNW